jgi:FlaA1/EpsC-like NDP-sugar epimerase
VRGLPVLVTGAGGYIGSALVRAIAAAMPAHLILLDSSEQNLFGIHSAMAARPDGVPHEPILGSVTDGPLLDDIFLRFRPQLVIHAAAFKHVALLERNPFAAIRNNAIGTYTLAQAAAAHNAGQLVLVSTDKAVNPRSIMGASKRLAELTVAALSSPACRMRAVRLGNVLGSPGSVVPIFQEQIAHGGPVTVTDPDATRYFMPLDAAVQAILAAAADTRSVVVPDLGEPRRIIDLARSLISGDTPIQFIGLRPGEKLHEDLRYPAEIAPSPSELLAYMARIERCLAQASLPHLIAAIRALVPEYMPA